MLSCVDVDYRAEGAVAGCAVFGDWPASEPAATRVAGIAEVAEYVPGEFYRRELPCILAVLAELRNQPTVVLVDGHVWLREGVPGLGAHLHAAVDGAFAVVGVAKTRYGTSSVATAVLRGESKKPLYVSAIGMDQAEAARCVRRMHGDHRLPTLLKFVDRLCRDAAPT